MATRRWTVSAACWLLCVMPLSPAYASACRPGAVGEGVAPANCMRPLLAAAHLTRGTPTHPVQAPPKSCCLWATLPSRRRRCSPGRCARWAGGASGTGGLRPGDRCSAPREEMGGPRCRSRLDADALPTCRSGRSPCTERSKAWCCLGAATARRKRMPLPPQPLRQRTAASSSRKTRRLRRVLGRVQGAASHRRRSARAPCRWPRRTHPTCGCPHGSESFCAAPTS